MKSNQSVPEKCTACNGKKLIEEVRGHLIKIKPCFKCYRKRVSPTVPEESKEKIELYDSAVFVDKYSDDAWELEVFDPKTNKTKCVVTIGISPSSVEEVNKECECYCHYSPQILLTPKGVTLRKECSHCMKEPTLPSKPSKEIKCWCHKCKNVHNVREVCVESEEKVGCKCGCHCSEDHGCGNHGCSKDCQNYENCIYTSVDQEVGNVGDWEKEFDKLKVNQDLIMDLGKENYYRYKNEILIWFSKELLLVQEREREKAIEVLHEIATEVGNKVSYEAGHVLPEFTNRLRKIK